MWEDEDYLSRKKARTVRDDRRDIMPGSVTEVHTGGRRERGGNPENIDTMLKNPLCTIS